MAANHARDGDLVDAQPLRHLFRPVAGPGRRGRGAGRRGSGRANIAFRGCRLCSGCCRLPAQPSGMWNALRERADRGDPRGDPHHRRSCSPAHVTQAVQKLSAAGGYGDVNPAELDFEKIQKRVGIVMLNGHARRSPTTRRKLAVSIYLGIAILRLLRARARHRLRAHTARPERCSRPTNRALPSDHHVHRSVLVFVALTALFHVPVFQVGQVPQASTSRKSRAPSARSPFSTSASFRSCTSASLLATR